MLQMVNAAPTLESHTQLMNSVYSDFSVLQEIFLPNTTTAVDPKLVLQTRGAYLPPAAPESPLQEPKQSPPGTPCNVPLSVKELEKEEEEDVSRLPTTSPPPSSVIRSTRSPQVDIVNLALEEIRKPPGGKVKEDASAATAGLKVKA